MHIPPPVLAAIAAAAILLADALVPATSFVFAGQRTVGAVVAVGGIALLAWSFVHFRRASTTILPDKLDERASDMTTLITDGPFAWSRNPIYLAMALFVTGIGIGLGSLVAPFAVAAFVWFIQTRQIVPEEHVLTRRFGLAYTDYAAHVNRWFGRRPKRIPGGGAAA